ncbi:S-adenosyl-L-methionine-dependent methyltransferases superfamily protein [Melia azedarach]|uniref:S-adenosyl-L-methionine-dependent methyltransferases superfamily protein n=1 Tax=Melia azedarach TaxID=155640 RepID=A0ACC1WXF5_MELAZ|nr:S-adenosyl-L-methionine-dependent methyltransferases superfamily protein [Melia azedarach]
MGFTMGLNLVLLLAMVATNILSLYHLSSTTFLQSPKPPSHQAVPDHLLHQLQTIRATINHLTRHHPATNAATTTTTSIPTTTIPQDLLLYSHLSPIASSCHNHPDLLHRYMNYTPFSLCPHDTDLQETLILHAFKSELDLPVPQLLQLAKSANSVIRLGIDVGGATGSFAARMKLYNITIVTTTMNLGAPYSEAAAFRGLVPLHVPLQQRLPVFDGVLDLVRCGHAVNRWIPVTMMEFLFYDVDRVLRGGGYLWLDRFFSKGSDLEQVYGPLIGKLGYKKVKWATANKTNSKNGEVYLTALLQKPVSK